MRHFKKVLVLGALVFLGSTSLNTVQAHWGCGPSVGYRSYSVGYGPGWGGHFHPGYRGASFYRSSFYGHPGFYSSQRAFVPSPVYRSYRPVYGGPGFGPGFGPGWHGGFGPGFRSGTALRIGF